MELNVTVDFGGAVGTITVRDITWMSDWFVHLIMCSLTLMHVTFTHLNILVKTTKFLILRNGTCMSATNQHSSQISQTVLMNWAPRQ